MGGLMLVGLDDREDVCRQMLQGVRDCVTDHSVRSFTVGYKRGGVVKLPNEVADEAMRKGLSRWEEYDHVALVVDLNPYGGDNDSHDAMKYGLMVILELAQKLKPEASPEHSLLELLMDPRFLVVVLSCWDTDVTSAYLTQVWGRGCGQIHVEHLRTDQQISDFVVRLYQHPLLGTIDKGVVDAEVRCPRLSQLLAKWVDQV